MTTKLPIVNKKSALKLSLSLSALLFISACSSDNTAVDDSAADSTTVDAVENTAVVEPVVVEPAIETLASEAVTPIADAAITQPVIDADRVNSSSNNNEAELLAVDTGAKLYESNCKVCHANGLLNAPKYGDKVAWSTRISKDKETLCMHSAQGFNKMPAQAVNGVSEAQVKASVDYMLAAVS